MTYFILIFDFSEKANLAVTLVDEQSSLIGHAAFYEQPNWSIKLDDDLTHGMAWLKRYYSAAECNVRNSINRITDRHLCFTFMFLSHA